MAHAEFSDTPTPGAGFRVFVCLVRVNYVYMWLSVEFKTKV